MPVQRTYLHITATTGQFETRLRKQARAALASNLFTDVLILAKKGRSDGHLPDSDALERHLTLRRIRVPSIAPGLNAILWFFSIAQQAISSKPTVISVHHVLLLPVGLLVKLFTGASLVYDAHELESESASLVGRPIRKVFCKIIERLLIGFCEHTIVVGDAIADWYRIRYGIVEITTIHNIPSNPPTLSDGVNRDLRTIFNIPSGRVVFIYQGVLSNGRGIPALLDIFSSGEVPLGALVVMGYGDLESIVQGSAAESASIYFHKAVPSEELLAYTASADVGLCLIEPICLSYRFALPNKFFEFMQAGIPVVVLEHSTAMSEILTRHEFGVSTTSDREAIILTLNALCQEDRSALRNAARATAKVYQWEREVERLVQLYARLLERTNSMPAAIQPK